MTGSPSFADTGFSFIRLRAAHLEMFRVAYARELPRIEDVLGRAMVDRAFIPIGACMLWFEPDGIVSLHAHFGDYLKTWPKDILRALRETADEARAIGVTDTYAYADREIAGSDKLLRWLGAEPTGHENEIGPIYRLDLRQSKI